VREHTNRKLIIVGSLTVIAIALSIYARWMPLFPRDIQLILLFQSYASGPFTFLMVWVSRLFGEAYAATLVILTGLLVLWRLGRLDAICVWTTGLLTLTNLIWKAAVNRPRPTPEEVNIIGVNHGNGFPSGHAFFAVIFLGFLAYLVLIHMKPGFWRGLYLIILMTFILLVGASRIYLGAHWPSDVLGGYVTGSIFLAILIWGHDRSRHFR
jgi:membrane-associated phospholipid phosphatase